MAREARPEEIPDCLALYDSLGLPYSEPGRRVLPEMFRALLAEDAMQIFLVQNRAAPRRSQVVSFGATVFVTDAFCALARSSFSPYLGDQLARHYLASKPVALNRKQIGRANARTGLNVMMCFSACRPDGLSRQHLLAVHEKQSEAFYHALGGYRVKEFVAELIGEEPFHRMLDAGARLRRNYLHHFRKRRLPVPQSARRPWLVGLTKEEAFAHPGAHVAGLFVCPAPRFHFNRSEQALLLHALREETCEELATSLFISPWTVKKRWQAIYERVAKIDHELLPPLRAGSLHATSRGLERRRHLLNYLRQHLEELRPSEFRSATSVCRD